jgi:rhamnosyltransferase subunit B
MLYRVGERCVLDPVVCSFINPWRRELGLPPMRRVTRWWHARSGVLCMFPDWYAPAQDDWPSPWMQTDFPLWNDRSDEPLTQQVEAYLGDGEPPIVFTPGSTNLGGKSFFAAAVDACQALGRRGVLLTKYPEQLPSRLPASVVHFPYVPLDLLLPRSAAFVHHGGIGSTSQAMLAGVPQVMMPLAHDQFDNAARIRRLYLGHSLSARSFNGSRLAVTLRSLLASPSVQTACREAANRLAPRDSLARSAEAIEARLGLESGHRG